VRRVAISGLGRIGRTLLRLLLAEPRLEVVALADAADAGTLAHLLRYDSVHGTPAFTVTAGEGCLHLAGRRIPLHRPTASMPPPFSEAGARLVLDCTEAPTSRAEAARHLGGGVTHVVMAGSCADADRLLFPGLNDADVDWEWDQIITCGSATALPLATLIQVLDGAFGLESAFSTSVHSYTSDQRILDLPHADLRLARAAALSIIPTPDSAPAEVMAALPRFAGRLAGLAVRVPTPDGCLLDVTARLCADAAPEAVHAAFRAMAAQGNLVEVLDEELVSRDLLGRTASCVYDPFLTRCPDPRLVKCFAWHDNETAHAARLRDACLLLLAGGQP